MDVACFMGKGLINFYKGVFAVYAIIQESLVRQEKGLELLLDLLTHEYRTLCERKMTLVAHQEFAIQELIRQLVEEKEFVMRMLKGVPLSGYADNLPDEEKAAILSARDRLDVAEQRTSRQAARNSQLVLALLDQNGKSLKTLFKEAVPEVSLVYGRRGSMHTLPSQGALISGRL
ncbi:MAG: flagellar export chaperone FlgN [Desulfovibrionaceae bacterium]|nr:flagellar export chaperone FlgN [Desulfovibrionaceae bacterium]